MIRKKYSSKRKTSIGSRAALLSVVIIIIASILLLSPSRADASATADPDMTKYYTCIYVDYGDTLWDIAAEYCTGHYRDYNEYIKEVKEINNLGSDNIRSGIKLCIPYYAMEPIG